MAPHPGLVALLFIVFFAGLAIVLKLVSTIRSVVGKVVLIGCYLVILLGCCLTILGVPLSAALILGRGA